MIVIIKEAGRGSSEVEIERYTTTMTLREFQALDNARVIFTYKGRHVQDDTMYYDVSDGSLILEVLVSARDAE